MFKDKNDKVILTIDHGGIPERQVRERRITFSSVEQFIFYLFISLFTTLNILA